MINEFEQVFLDAYRAPRGEVAIMKQVPISELEYVRGIFRKLGIPVRIRFRGPRRDRGLRLTTLKRDAVRFSVYHK